MPGFTVEEVADAAQLASLADETPEGRSIVVLAKEFGLRGRHIDPDEATFVEFTAQTRMSGIDLDGPDFDFEFSAGNVDAVLGAEASFEVGPELKVLLYNVMGPSAALKVGARLEVDRDQSPCYRLLGTVNGEVGVFVGFDELPGFALIDETQPFSLLEQEFDSEEEAQEFAREIFAKEIPFVIIKRSDSFDKQTLRWQS